MKIERTPLILVDELQHIVDGQRGLKEEQLLMEVFGRPPSPPPPRFIGLSASLSPTTKELLQKWFAANLLRVDLLEVTARPVPPDRHRARQGRQDREPHAHPRRPQGSRHPAGGLEHDPGAGAGGKR